MAAQGTLLHPLSHHAPHALRRCQQVHVATGTRPAGHNRLHTIANSGGFGVRTEDHLSMPSLAQAVPSHLQSAAALGHYKPLNT